MSVAPLERCPHCGSDARVVAHAAYRLRCNACGKPRFAFDGQRARTDEPTRQGLATAHAKRLSKLAWQWAALGAGLLGFAALFIAALVGLFASSTLWISLPVSAVPWALAALFLRLANRARAESDAELQLARQSGARALYRAYQDQLTSSTLSACLGVPHDEAAQLLAEAEVDDWLMADAPDARLRVATDPDDPTGQAEQEALDELERTLDETEPTRRASKA
jgi:hypothetical protein